jgi:hypothetical protein
MDRNEYILFAGIKTALESIAGDLTSIATEKLGVEIETDDRGCTTWIEQFTILDGHDGVNEFLAKLPDGANPRVSILPDPHPEPAAVGFYYFVTYKADKRISK